MLPVIAIIGRPNVGKSTLFNCLTKSREAIVADLPGVTRDRKYGQGKLGSKPHIVIDTAGIAENDSELDLIMTHQAELAAAEANEIIFLVDGGAGLTDADQEIAQFLRQLNKKIYIVVNKTDGLNPDVAIGDFFSLGLGEPYPIVATQGKGVKQLIEKIVADFPEEASDPVTEIDHSRIRVAIIGKPNVGKSTLVNRLLGEERVIVFDEAGTTRDTQELPLERNGQHYTIIDTAGIRKRGRINESVEKFSVVKSLQAIEHAHVVLYVIDAKQGITDQDASLLGFLLDAGRSLVIVINKWDGLSHENKKEIQEEIKDRLHFVDFAETRYISALHGSGVGDLFHYVDTAFASAMCALTTNKVTLLLQQAVREHQPPLVSGRRIKLRFANPGGHNPPIIVIHGNQTDNLPQSYKRYLTNFYRSALKLVGTPLLLRFKSSENPFQDKK
jgi:GTP-binding protein